MPAYRLLTGRRSCRSMPAVAVEYICLNEHRPTKSMLSWRKVTSQSVVRASTKWCLSYGLMPKNIPTICNTYAFRFSQAQAFNAPGAIPVLMISPLIIMLILLLHQFVSQIWPPALFKWRVRRPFRIHICCTIAFSDHDDPKMNLSLNLIQRKSAPSI